MKFAVSLNFLTFLSFCKKQVRSPKLLLIFLILNPNLSEKYFIEFIVITCVLLFLLMGNDSCLEKSFTCSTKITYPLFFKILLKIKKSSSTFGDKFRTLFTTTQSNFFFILINSDFFLITRNFFF